MENQVTKFFNAGKELPEKSNSLWLIKKGIVKSYTVSQQDKTVILGFWGEEEVVGKSLSNIEPYFLQCMTDVRAMAVSAFEEKNISSNLLNKIRQTQELSCIIRNPQKSDRLWLFLKWLGNKFGRNIPQGRLINFPVTTRELADTVGMEKILVAEILDKFQRDGWIERSPEEKIILKKE